MSYVESEGVKVPGKILIQVLESETGKILKQADKEGMFEAFNYGIFWYEKFLTENWYTIRLQKCIKKRQAILASFYLNGHRKNHWL